MWVVPDSLTFFAHTFENGLTSWGRSNHCDFGISNAVPKLCAVIESSTEVNSCAHPLLPLSLPQETIPATPATSTDTSSIVGVGTGSGGGAGVATAGTAGGGGVVGTGTASALGDIASSLGGGGGGGGSASESEAYAGLMKDADKLKLMLLAWNYQNSTAVRNGTEGPDLSVVGGLWAQYQNALAQNAAAVAAASSKMDSSLSPVPRQDTHSPMEAQDETNSSGQKEEDEVSEDDSDDKLDEKLATTHDPERLKAFNVSKLERERSE